MLLHLVKRLFYLKVRFAPREQRIPNKFSFQMVFIPACFVLKYPGWFCSLVLCLLTNTAI